MHTQHTQNTSCILFRKYTCIYMLVLHKAMVDEYLE